MTNKSEMEEIRRVTNSIQARADQTYIAFEKHISEVSVKESRMQGDISQIKDTVQELSNTVNEAHKNMGERLVRLEEARDQANKDKEQHLDRFQRGSDKMDSKVNFSLFWKVTGLIFLILAIFAGWLFSVVNPGPPSKLPINGATRYEKNLFN